MIRPLLLSLAVLALLAQAPPPGPPAEARYHAGARAFIDGDDARALASVEAGLALAPDDARLRALRDLIQQQQDQQDDQGGDQQDEADEQDAGDQGEDGDQGESGEQPSQEEPPGDEGPEAEQDQTRTESPSEAQAGEAPPQPAAREPDAMTPAQAQRILDAVGGEEQLLLRELRRAPSQRSRSDKDW